MPSRLYHSSIDGAAFVAHLGLRRLGFWLADKEKSIIVKTSDVQSVSTQRNGQTKLSLRLRKDLIIPTNRKESLQLVEALSPLLAKAQEGEPKKEIAAKIRLEEERILRLLRRRSKAYQR